MSKIIQTTLTLAASESPTVQGSALRRTSNTNTAAVQVKNDSIGDDYVVELQATLDSQKMDWSPIHTFRSGDPTYVEFTLVDSTQYRLKLISGTRVLGLIK